MDESSRCSSVWNYWQSDSINQSSIYLLRAYWLMKKIALIGASENPESLAHRLFFRLEKWGFTVAPINPNCSEIGGKLCINTIFELEKKPDLVLFMVNPRVSLLVLEQVVAMGLKKVWFQSGTFDDAVINFCKEHHLVYENEKCALITPLDIIEEFILE